jgi:hypothetical protein
MEMNWRFFFAHDWTEDRSSWENVYLLPDDPNHQRDSFCVTVDAIGPGGNACYSAEENAAACERLRDGPYHIDGQKMIVRGEDYSKEELLAWVRLWLEAAGFSVGQLVEGSYEEFRGTNWHSRLVEGAGQRTREGDRE